MKARTLYATEFFMITKKALCITTELLIKEFFIVCRVTLKCTYEGHVVIAEAELLF